MKYLLLIYEAEANWTAKTDAQKEATLAAHRALGDKERADGKWLAAHRLMPTEAATSVHLAGGKPVVTDGPFAETREALGGFYLLDCVDLDEAISYASMLSAAESGIIEIRPVMY
jgi:hypothetical protein